MQYETQAANYNAARPSIGRPALARLLAGAALWFAFASAQADQLLVTAANSVGNAVYDLNISPSGATPPTPVISSTTTPVNTAADGAAHGNFDALVWVPNSYCKSLDLIAADSTKGQIVRYQGAASLSATGCFNPTNGTPSVSSTAQIIFKWTTVASGPAHPNGISADSYGNLFVVSSSSSKDLKPSLWVLPINNANGAYGAPVLIDNTFGKVLTLALAETVVASTGAVTNKNTVLWNAGDLLVLVGDSLDARLTVYSKAKIYGLNTNGAIATNGLPVSGPSSIAIPFLSFLEQLAVPFGMDIFPATTPGTDTSVLFTTIDGRILRFDTVQNKFVSNFASRLGFGLQKLKVGIYANVPYAFVAQLGARNTGQILAFRAPPASGANSPLARVSTGVMDPVGLAVSNSGSQPVPTAPPGTTPCAPPNPACVFSPLGPNVVTTTLTAYPGDQISGTVQEQLCIVQSDPRVTAVITGNTYTWSCSGTDLQIGTGTPYCPAFPTAFIPGSVCGHSGPTGSGFAVMQGTATGLDPFANNSFFSTEANIDTVLPGPANLECANFSQTGLIQLMAYGPRSDLPTIEGVIPEDSLFASLFLGGQPGYLMESTSYCDPSKTGSHGISLFAFGLGLSSTSPAYLYSLLNQKYAALNQTVVNANISPSTVETALQTDIANAQTYVTAAQNGGNLTANIDCALSQIYATDVYVRNNLPAFSSSLVMTPPGGGNPDPAPDIDARLANWYLTLNTELLGNAPPPPPPPPASPTAFPVPAGSVPACTLTALYSVGGTVSGLTGSGLVLQDSYDDTSPDMLPVTGNGGFTFPADLANGAAYYVTVSVQPTGQSCTVTNGSGSVSNANITNVVVSCSAASPQMYSVGGTISGLTGTLTLENAVNDDLLSLTAPGPFAFPADLPSGGTYGILIGQPTGQFCSVSGAAGTVTNANVTSVVITCVASPPQPAIADFAFAPLESAAAGGAGGFSFYSDANASYCILTSLDLYQGSGTITELDPEGPADIIPLSSIVAGYPPIPTGSPDYGTDVQTLTCYGALGTTAAFAGPLLISNPGLPAPKLSITSFTAVTSEPNYGTVNWTTSNSTPNTSCAIMDEFSGATSPNQTPYTQNPILGLPANNSGSIYPYRCAYPPVLDTMTLVCTDPNNGTAYQTLTVIWGDDC
jgi:hypothetical protein